MFINLKKVYQVDITKRETELVKSLRDKASTLTTLVFLDELVAGSEEEVLLLKILGAVNLSDSNYVFISRNNYPRLCLMHFDASIFTNLKNVIVFGLPSKAVGLNTITQKYVNMNIGKHQLLLADSLTILQKEAALKGRLWNNLKTMYGVS